MDVSLWYLALGWVTLYTLVSLLSVRTNRVPSYLTPQGPLTLVHTVRGLKAVDRIATRFPRFWRIWGDAGVVLFGLGLVVGSGLMVFSAVRVITQPDSAPLASDPQNMLVIPGVNEYLPLAAAPALVTALAIAMVIHELGHAIYCRLGDIDIESTGLVLIALIPAGAFVEPNEGSQEHATRMNRLRMVSAGVMNNLGAAVIGLFVLVVVVPLVVTPAPGVAVGGVLPASPADEAGLSSGDRIVAVEGTSIESVDDFQQTLSAAEQASVTLATADGGQHTLSRQVFVSGSAVPSQLPPGATITAVDGTPVSTVSDFYRTLQTEDTRVILMTESGETVQHIVGARVTVREGTVFSESVQESDHLYVTYLNGERILTAADLSETLNSVGAGEVVTVRGVTAQSAGGEDFETTYTASHDGTPFAATAGVGGVSVLDVGIEQYPAEAYLGYITAGEVSVWASLLLIIFLPFGTIGGLPYNFAGFTPNIVGFYQVVEPLSSATPAVLFAVSLAYWTVWINVNLALFNCLPTFALDGGHYTRYSLETLAAKLGSPNPKQESQAFAKMLMAAMGLGVLAVMVIPPLFG